MNDPVIAIRGTTFHNKLYQSSCACLQNLSTKFRSYVLKLIHIFGHVLMVNSSYYGRCYVKKKKKLIPLCTFLKGHVTRKVFFATCNATNVCCKSEEKTHV